MKNRMKERGFRERERGVGRVRDREEEIYIYSGLGIVTCDLVLALEQSFDSYSRRLFCCNTLYL